MASSRSPRDSPPRRALITGATAGLGREFAVQLAEAGYDLVLVARTAGRLHTAAADLATAYGIDVEVLTADLAVAAELESVERRLANDERPVTMLINNAGFGLIPPFHANAVDAEQRLLDVLVTAPMRLSHAALGTMRARHHGTIISVASVAAYSPRGTYGAAKAWVVSFSRWANVEYRRDGVTVTALVPGFVRTEFHERMGARDDTIPAALWLAAPDVVRAALRGAARGRAVVVPSLRYKAIVAMTRLLPARIAAAGSLHPR